MKRLIGTQRNGHRLERAWKHFGDDGREKITVETVEDVEPVFGGVKRRAQSNPGKDFRYVASIPQTLVEEVTRQSAKLWNIKPREAFAELMAGKTDRAKRVWRTLSQHRDYAKLQAKTYK